MFDPPHSALPICFGRKYYGVGKSPFMTRFKKGRPRQDEFGKFRLPELENAAKVCSESGDYDMVEDDCRSWLGWAQRTHSRSTGKYCMASHHITTFGDC